MVCRVTWLLERVTEVAAGECQGGLSRAALANAKGISEDFALLRPILGALLTIPADPAVNEGFSGMARASSAPAPMKAAAEPGPPEARPPLPLPSLLELCMLISLCSTLFL